MASFHTKTFLNYDDYMTPKKAWEDIKQYIPNKTIWEPFYGDGKSGEYLTELGFNVIHEKDCDFFENNKGDIIISNPPFSKIKEILNRLYKLDKPFILILPVSKINTNYFRETFGTTEKSKNLHLLIPRKRIQFNKYINNSIIKLNKCNFDCLYYCYKIETLINEPSLIWLK